LDLVLLVYDLGNKQNGFQSSEERASRLRGRIFIVTAGMNDADYVRAPGPWSLRHFPQA